AGVHPPDEGPGGTDRPVDGRGPGRRPRPVRLGPPLRGGARPRPRRRAGAPHAMAGRPRLGALLDARGDGRDDAGRQLPVVGGAMDFERARIIVQAHLDRLYRNERENPRVLEYGFDLGDSWAPLIDW